MTWLCTLLAINCLSGTISGPATVQDGDTIYVAKQAVRLFGVDAEELSEPNGYAAKAHMILLIHGRRVTCTWKGFSYKRVVGLCYVGHDYSLNAQIISDGYALDCAHYSHGLYRSLEPAGARSRLIQKGYCK